MAAGPQPGGAAGSRLGAAALLLAGTILAYWNAFRGAFQFDDVTILSDPRIENGTAFLSHLRGMIRPALKLSFLIDRRLWGDAPAGYHLLNLLLHLGSGLLVFAIVGRLARHRGIASRAIPFFTALLFLVHPIATETVTYISGRATGLMAFFYLAGILLYLRSTESRASGVVRAEYAGAIGSFVLSLLSKETAITFPLALMLIESVGRGRTGADLRRRLVRLHWPFWGVLAAFLVGALASARYVQLLTISLGIRPVYENLLTQANAIAYALSLFAWPARLNFDHDITPAASIVIWPTPLSLFLLFSLVGTAILLARRNALASLGVFWFFLQLLPTQSLLPRYDVLSERNLYLAAPGLFLAAVAMWEPLIRWNRASALALRLAALAIATLLAVATMARNAVYASPVALWSDAVRKSPAKARPHANLGHAYYSTGDFDRAISEFRTALGLDRDDPVVQDNLRAAWHRKAESSGR